MTCLRIKSNNFSAICVVIQNEMKLLHLRDFLDVMKFTVYEFMEYSNLKTYKSFT